MNKNLQLSFICILLIANTTNLTAKCLPYASLRAGWTFANKDCKYTFTANTMIDSNCFSFAWYSGKTLLGTGKTYTTTFSTNDTTEYKLVIKNLCDTSCKDTSILKKIGYKCGTKCNWNAKKAGWTFANKDCKYTFTANSMIDSNCFSFAWYSGKTLLGTGKTYTTTFSTNDTTEYKLVIKNLCDSTCVDTSIVKKIGYNCGTKCNWNAKKAGWTFANKDCKYTFTANSMIDSNCFSFAWYSGKTLLGTGKTYTTTFSTNDSAEYKLVIKNLCDSTCVDTSIVKKIGYNCGTKCNWNAKKAGWTFANKDCKYTFTANSMIDSNCFYFAWYSGKTLLGTGKTYTTTFSTNDSAEYKLVIKNLCDSTCVDTNIVKKIGYNCGTKCNWNAKKAGWTFIKKDCKYILEATNLKDSCTTYTWLNFGKVIGTDRILTYDHKGKDSVEICLKLKDTCKNCDTFICKTLFKPCPVGMDKRFNQSEDIKIYPNPSNSGFEIEKLIGKKFTLTIFNIMGSEVKVQQTENTNSVFIDTKSLSNGIYFIQLNFNTTLQTLKIVVQH